MAVVRDGSTSTWNTAALPRRLGCDALSAWCAGGLVAPVIAIIDRCAGFFCFLPRLCK
jgi:hypothetical protein